MDRQCGEGTPVWTDSEGRGLLCGQAVRGGDSCVDRHGRGDLTYCQDAMPEPDVLLEIQHIHNSFSCTTEEVRRFLLRTGQQQIKMQRKSSTASGEITDLGKILFCHILVEIL